MMTGVCTLSCSTCSESKEGLSLRQMRDMFISYMQENGHTSIQPVSLLPTQKGSTLFTIAGVSPHMEDFSNFVTKGTTFELGNLLTNSQPCFRMNDIGDLGDGRHTTCFEMLGKRSLNQQTKQDQLELWYGFLVDRLGLDPKNLYQTVYVDEIGEVDNESVEAMKSIFGVRGISDADVAPVCVGAGEEGTGQEINFKDVKIFPYGADKNRWQRGDDEGELGGPCSETFIDTGKEHNPDFGEYCHPNCDCGRFVEIGNSVFMQYIRQGGDWLPSEKMIVDFGGGLERLVLASMLQRNKKCVQRNKQEICNVFTTDAFVDNIRFLETFTGKKYKDNMKSFEILCDHIKSISLLIKDGLTPANNGQGSVLRKLMRNMLNNGSKLGIELSDENRWKTLLNGMLDNVIDLYDDIHPELESKKDSILELMLQERTKFQTILKKLNKFFQDHNGSVDAKLVFDGYTSLGIPVDVLLEECSIRGIRIDMGELDRLIVEHKEKSKAGK